MSVLLNAIVLLFAVSNTIVLSDRIPEQIYDDICGDGIDRTMRDGMAKCLLMLSMRDQVIFQICTASLSFKKSATDYTDFVENICENITIGQTVADCFDHVSHKLGQTGHDHGNGTEVKGENVKPGDHIVYDDRYRDDLGFYAKISDCIEIHRPTVAPTVIVVLGTSTKPPRVKPEKVDISVIYERIAEILEHIDERLEISENSPDDGKRNTTINIQYNPCHLKPGIFGRIGDLFDHITRKLEIVPDYSVRLHGYDCTDLNTITTNSDISDQPSSTDSPELSPNSNDESSDKSDHPSTSSSPEIHVTSGGKKTSKVFDSYEVDCYSEEEIVPFPFGSDESESEESSESKNHKGSTHGSHEKSGHKKHKKSGHKKNKKSKNKKRKSNKKKTHQRANTENSGEYVNISPYFSFLGLHDSKNEGDDQFQKIDDENIYYEY